MSFGKSSKDDKDTTASPSYLGSSSPASSSSASSLGASSDSSEKSKLEAFLGKGSKIVGNLTFTGPVELDGYVEGEINAQDRIIIGESAVVNGRIIGGEVIVRGTVNGDISANKKLSLKKPARIIGNLSSTNLSIEEGVVFEGQCIMGSSAENSKGMGQPRVLAATKVGANA